MWYISILFFYLYGVASIVSPSMTDISGPWISMFTVQENCTDQQCGNNTSAMRTTFQLGDGSWVEKVLVGTGSCTDLNWMANLVMVVESYGTYVVDLDAMDNDSFPVNFEPEPQIQIQPEFVPVPEPELTFVPSINPAPESNQPAVIINPSPAVNPGPAINAPDTDLASVAPAQNNDGKSPAELNPSPYIIIPLEPEVSLIPIVQMPQPSQQPSTVPVNPGNFSIWLHVISTPLKYQITLLDEDEDEFVFTGTETGCMPPIQYWQDETFGCPCNGNWFGNGTWNDASETFVGGRKIVPKDCPASTCPEAYFINDTVKYGNVRMNVTVFENGTIINKTLEITKMSPFKEIGYAFGAGDVVYLLRFGDMSQQYPVNTLPAPEGENNPAPYVIKTPEQLVEPENSSGSLLPLATTITMIFVFLLMLH
jgi:hypothetical protein